MPLTLTPSEDDVFTALRAFLQDILPAQDPDAPIPHIVVAGQENRVPEPVEKNYVVFWPLRLPRLSTNFERLIEQGLRQEIRQAAQAVFQLDVHGPDAMQNAAIISTLFRSSYAVEFFEALQLPVSPLYADDPRQAPFINGEQQYEDRWIVEANLQVNFTSTIDTTSARTLTVDIIDVETPEDSWPNSTATATGS